MLDKLVFEISHYHWRDDMHSTYIVYADSEEDSLNKYLVNHTKEIKDNLHAEEIDIEEPYYVG